MARTWLAEVLGLGFAHVRPDGFRWISSTVFEVDFALPSDADTLVVDTSGTDVVTASIPGYYGLLLNDGAVTPPTITGHSITAGGYTNRTLRGTLSAPPAGQGPILLSYAHLRNAGEASQDGNVVGARGCLRASTAYSNLRGGTDYDWCPPFLYNLGRP